MVGCTNVLEMGLLGEAGRPGAIILGVEEDGGREKEDDADAIALAANRGSVSDADGEVKATAGAVLLTSEESAELLI
jgi:hypothetical protein